MKKFTKAAMFLTAVSIGLVGCGQAKTKTAEIPSQESSQGEKQKDVCRLPRYLTKPRQRRSEWDMAGSDGISRVSAVFRGKSLLTNKMRII